jgi:hypothetical protein
MPVHACGSRCAREGTSSEAELARGRQRPSSGAEPARGSVSPRARRISFEGGVNPRARRTLLEGVPCWAALVGRGGHRSGGRAVCACFVLGLRCVLRFLKVLSRIPPGFLGDPLGCPRQCAWRWRSRRRCAWRRMRQQHSRWPRVGGPAVAGEGCSAGG